LYHHPFVFSGFNLDKKEFQGSYWKLLLLASVDLNPSARGWTFSRIALRILIKNAKLLEFSVAMNEKEQEMRMKLCRAFAVVVPLFASVCSYASTLEKVQKSKKLICGINGGLPGFSYTDPKGEIRGLDADFCRAVAAAVGVTPEFKPLNTKVRFTALQSGEVDLLTRNTTMSTSRDSKLGFDFPGTLYFDGQGFMVPKKLKVKTAKELGGASICVQTGTTTELNLNDFFARNKLKFKAVVFDNVEDASKAYLAGRCDVFTTDASQLAGARSSFKNPEEHLILPDLISKEPLSPVVRHGDNAWGDIVRWTLYALITAEEKSITKANVMSQVKSLDPEVQRLLGGTGTLGTDMGLKNDWAVKAIAETGNYGEIFNRNVGKESALKLERGLNSLWSQGGILYSPPFN
jgi:general L-amino acid transport system substrate-binding protein